MAERTQEQRHWYSRVSVWVFALAGLVFAAVLTGALLVAGQGDDTAATGGTTDGTDGITGGTDDGTDDDGGDAEPPPEQDVLAQANPELAALLDDVRYDVYEGEVGSVAPEVVSLDEFDEQRSYLIDADGDAGDLLVFVRNFALVSEDYQTWIGALPGEAEVVDLEPYLDEG